MSEGFTGIKYSQSLLYKLGHQLIAKTPFLKEIHRIIITFLILSGCYSCKSTTDLAEITFWCVDQVGNPIPEVNISIDNKKLISDQQGKCVYPIKFTDDKRWLNVSASKEGFDFLDPQFVFLQKGQKVHYTLSSLRKVKMTFLALEGKQPVEVDVYRNKNKIGVINKNSGRLIYYLEPEATSQQRFYATYNHQKISRTVRVTREHLDSGIVIRFDFKPPPSQPSSPLPSLPQEITLIISTDELHTIISPKVKRGDNEENLRTIVVNSRISSIILDIKNKGRCKIPLRIKPGNTQYKIECYYDKGNAILYNLNHPSQKKFIGIKKL